MGFFDRLFGLDDEQQGQRNYREQGRAGRSEEDIALERYRYLVNTAPPERLEQAHREAFERLSPEQRQRLHAALVAAVPPGEAPASTEPGELARAATRAEVLQPGIMERILRDDRRNAQGQQQGVGQGPVQDRAAWANGEHDEGPRGGMGFGSMFASSLLGSVAGYVIGSAIMSSFLPPIGADFSADAAAEDPTASGGDMGGDGGFGDFGF